MKKLPVSTKQNNWFDSQNVDNLDLTLEQNYNTQVQTGIINNHFGTGVVADVLVQNILFDSSLTTGLLDGYVNVQTQPSDNNLGNQLEIKLIGSAAAGNRSVKLLIIGLDFEDNLQYDTFTFYTNETQISSKHYTQISKLFFNDFVGLTSQSLNLGGTLTIKEAIPFSLSRDCKMVSQDIEPNLFFRDFFVAGSGSLQALLQNALPSYNINNLNIKTGYKELRSLVENDVSSQIGQKFLATTNNIEKITLLMSVINNITPSDLAWTGNIIVSIYQLQSVVNCPTDLVPSLAIDFDPSNVPLAQLSMTYNDFLNMGIILNTVPQPVDFVFSNTQLAAGSLIVPTNFYAVTVKRAGSANKCQIQLAVGGNDTPNSQLTLFNGSIWIDIPESDLWFQVWTDAAKVSDGQAYDAGYGMQITKTSIDPNTGATIDNSLGQVSFLGNAIYYAHAFATELDADPVQDERTGNPILSTKQFIPSVELLNSIAVNTLEQSSNPLLIGTITDTNVKSFDSTPISASFHEFGMIQNKVLMKLLDGYEDGYFDGYRYDFNVLSLASSLVNNNLTNAKFIPNTSNTSLFYRIAKAELVTLIYGDLDRDGLVTQNDLSLAQGLLNAQLNIAPTDQNYIALTTFFTNNISLSFQIQDPNSLSIVASGSDGQITVNPIDGTVATFNSLTATFLTNMDGYNCIVTGSSSPNLGDNGTFTILSLINSHNITIKKTYYTADTILQIFQADIDADMWISNTDITLISNYVNKVATFPAPTSPGNNVGKQFQAIELTLETYVDRNDDYDAVLPRSSNIHILPDVFQDGYVTSSFGSHNFYSSPIQFQIIKQLNWQDNMVAVESNPKLVSVNFEYESGATLNSCVLSGIEDTTMPIAASFDPGRNDFFIPNNLVIGAGGQLVTSDGYSYKIDYEVGTIILDIPAITFTSERVVNLLTDFIANYSGDGKTRLGFESLRFADCSFVGLDALAKNQLRFSVGIQSMSPQLSGIDLTSISGVIVDGKVGVSIDPVTSLLSLNFSNLYEDPVLQTLSTKVQVNIFIKKSGWNNQPLTVNSTICKNILGL